jgi:1,4-alpha-glucan branching enzyme
LVGRRYRAASRGLARKLRLTGTSALPINVSTLHRKDSARMHPAGSSRMTMRWTFRRVRAMIVYCMMYSKTLKILSAVLSACLSLTAVALAQSSRPGWGSVPYHDVSGTGVTFRVWAPNATSVYVPGQFNSWSTTANPLAKEYTNAVWTGAWSADVSSARPGHQYKYYLNYSGGSVWKQDPRARLVQYSGSGGNSIVYDPTVFNWAGDSLTPPALNDLVIYEIHAGTFSTNAGLTRFLAATNKLDYLKSLGVNAVEIMPVAEFAGDYSWGYNPAQLFAVENVAYGGPDGLKTFVRACHARGLAVLLDVLHNHYGPSDLEMWNFDGYQGVSAIPGGGGIYFYQSNTNLQITPWGNTRPNFSSQPVRNFVQDNFTFWLDEYHVDGFRWDTPDTMMHGNDGTYISEAGDLITSINDMMHTSYAGKISISEDVYNSKGFDSAWDTDYPGKVRTVLTAASDSSRDMYAIRDAILYNVRYGGNAGSGRVAFLETHDVVGDHNGGVRLATAIDSTTPNSYWARKRSTLGAAIVLTAPGVPMIFQGQEMLENKAFSDTNAVDWTKTNTYRPVVQFYRDVIGARRDLKGTTPGLKGDQCAMLQVDNANKLVAFHRWNSAAPGQDAVVIANFANATRNNYVLTFPAAGNWYVHLNSDSTNYSSDYGNIGSTMVTASGSPATAGITIGPYSALILSQTPNTLPQLTIASTNGAVTVSWPAAYTGWTLFTNPSPAAAAGWTEVPPSQYQTNASIVSLTVSPPAGNTFYRLQKM